jgi:hypothetical protein
MLPTSPVTSKTENHESFEERKALFADRLTELFKVDTAIIYSVSNMHYRGTLLAIGPKQLAVMARGALPFIGSKVSVRYPLEDSPTSPRIVVHALTEMVLEPFGQEAGVFHAMISKVDELGNRGLFRTHLRNLNSSRTERW